MSGGKHVCSFTNTSSTTAAAAAAAAAPLNTTIPLHLSAGPDGAKGVPQALQTLLGALRLWPQASQGLGCNLGAEHGLVGRRMHQQRKHMKRSTSSSSTRSSSNKSSSSRITPPLPPLLTTLLALMAPKVSLKRSRMDGRREGCVSQISRTKKITSSALLTYRQVGSGERVVSNWVSNESVNESVNE